MLPLRFRQFHYLKKLSVLDDCVSEQKVDYVISMIKDGRGDDLEDIGDDCICITSRGKPIKAKTVGQKHYVDAIKNNMVVMGIGPAGTGKTFLAVAMAVKALRNKQVSRIILTRPAIEAGEKLGFLPGDLQPEQHFRQHRAQADDHRIQPCFGLGRGRFALFHGIFTPFRNNHLEYYFVFSLFTAICPSRMVTTRVPSRSVR